MNSTVNVSVEKDIFETNYWHLKKYFIVHIETVYTCTNYKLYMIIIIIIIVIIMILLLTIIILIIITVLIIIFSLLAVVYAQQVYKRKSCTDLSQNFIKELAKCFV